MISSHAICDQCERKLVPVGDDNVDEGYLSDSGWLVLKWSEGDEEDRQEEARDFCSVRCVVKWSMKEVQGGEVDSGAAQEGPEKQGGRSV